ncbi:unnamed protein product, partial [Didymodactylos carnosus]
SNESTSAWIEKQRLADIEKRKAAERAKLLQQMDEEFGLEELVKEETEKLIKSKEKKYTARDLTGLRIEHSADTFKEGQQIILTLKDQRILREKKPGEPDTLEDDEDVLINVNIADDERTTEKIEGKKKKTGRYRAYKDEDNDVDKFGLLTEARLLDQYDDKKKSSFKLESGGKYDLSDEKIMSDMRKEFHSRMQTLELPAMKLASEFYTQEEIEQFKKPKKVIKKKLRTRKILKADDLLAMDVAAVSASRHHRDNTSAAGPVTTAKGNATRQKDRTNGLVIDELKREDDDVMASDIIGPDDDDNLSDFALEDDAFKELQDVVNKTMKLKTKVTHVHTAEKALSSLIEERDRKMKMEIKEEPMEVSTVAVPNQDKPEGLILDTMSEFCRNLGEDAATSVSSAMAMGANTSIPVTKFNRPSTIRSRIQRPQREALALDHDDELLEYAMAVEQEDDDDEDNNNRMNGDDENPDGSVKPFRLEDSVLDEEPGLDRGLANALRLVEQKGYLEKDKGRQNARMTSEISAKHFTVEEKNYYDIDDKYARRDRYSGPLTDFKEKEAYRPEVKLEYVDDTGRRMNRKEAFRYLSHRFHGKGSGKKKTEKRTKKLIEEELMKKMSSVDTPLNTVALLQQKQAQLQQPYITLSTTRMREQGPQYILVFDFRSLLHLMTDTIVTNTVNANDDISHIENEQATLDHNLTSVTITENEKDDEWKSMDGNDDDEAEEETKEIKNENYFPDEDDKHSSDWANFASFKNDDKDIHQENNINLSETTVTKEENDDEWADFEYNTTPSQPTIVDSTLTKNNEEDVEFGDFNEGHISAESNSFVEEETKPLPSSIHDVSGSIDHIESIIQTCFSYSSSPLSTIEFCEYSELPTFTNNNNNTTLSSCLKPCLNVWNVLSNISNDPYGLKFQWRKSNSERFFHQALGVNERYRTKTTPLMPEILQPEKIKSTMSNNSAQDELENKNKPSSSLNPHFDWKASGLENPLAGKLYQTNSVVVRIGVYCAISVQTVSLPSNSISKTNEDEGNETYVFDANKTLDLDYFHPSKPSDLTSSSSVKISSISLPTSSQINGEHSSSTKTSVPPIKTTGLFPGSSSSSITTINNDEAKRILDSLPNLSFMSAKNLMFSVRLNGGNDETTSLY